LNPKIYRALAQSALVLACAFIAVAPTLAQDAAPPATAKWRPREGIYASPGKGFAEACGEYGNLTVELHDKSISGNEWGCKVRTLADTGPDAIKIEMTCDDYNLAEDIKKPEGTVFKEVMLLRKIDDKSIMARKTFDGKFRYPEWKAVYCPEKYQQMYREGKATNKVETERQKELAKSTWRPRDGVYATVDADFDDRCRKSGDTVVRLTQSAMSLDGNSCYVALVSVEQPNSVSLNLTCGGSIGALATDSVTLAKIDDQSLILRRSRNGQLTESGKQLTYCPEAAQREIMQSTAK